MTGSEKSPLASLLMCVYNGEKFIAQAVESLLGQTFGDFELIVIDDGSVDQTQAILSGYANRDRRIRLFRQEHRGIVPAANRGLELARGRYLARMDADDFSASQRLEVQVQVLEAQPDLAIVGSAIYVTDENGRPLHVARPPLADTAIRWALLFDNPFVQSSVMLRLAALREHHLAYDPAVRLSEDYDLWSRLLAFGKGLNLSEPLAYRRTHALQVSEIDQDECLTNAAKIAQRNLGEMGFDLTLDEVRTLRNWQRELPLIGENDRLLDEMFAILEKFEEKGGLDPIQIGLIRSRWMLRLGLARSARWGGHLRKLKYLPRFHLNDYWMLIRYLYDRQVYISAARVEKWDGRSSARPETS